MTIYPKQIRTHPQ